MNITSPCIFLKTGFPPFLIIIYLSRLPYEVTQTRPSVTYSNKTLPPAGAAVAEAAHSFFTTRGGAFRRRATALGLPLRGGGAKRKHKPAGAHACAHARKAEQSRAGSRSCKHSPSQRINPESSKTGRVTATTGLKRN